MTTFSETNLECPVCGENVAARVVHSTNQMGQDTDFCPVTMGFHAVPLVIRACSNCGYAGYDSDFHDRDYAPDERMAFINARVGDGLIPLEARLDDLSPDHAYYLAFLTRRHFGAPPADLGDLLLKASWCLRLDGGRPRDDVAASRYRREAIREFECALRAEETPEGERRTYRYLVAELHRREGEFEEAAAGFDRFIEDPPDEPSWTRAAIGLKRRSRARDAANYTFEEILRVVGPSRGE